MRKTIIIGLLIVLMLLTTACFQTEDDPVEEDDCVEEGGWEQTTLSPEYQTHCCEGLQSYYPWPGDYDGGLSLCYDPDKMAPRCYKNGHDGEGWYYISEYITMAIEALPEPGQFLTHDDCSKYYDCLEEGASGCEKYNPSNEEKCCFGLECVAAGGYYEIDGAYIHDMDHMVCADLATTYNSPWNKCFMDDGIWVQEGIYDGYTFGIYDDEECYAYGGECWGDGDRIKSLTQIGDCSQGADCCIIDVVKDMCILPQRGIGQSMYSNNSATGSDYDNFIVIGTIAFVAYLIFKKPKKKKR